MKLLKSAVIFSVLFLFLTVTTLPVNSQKLSEYGMKKVAARDILQENTDVLQFFKALPKRESNLLNNILRENYLAGYYAEVFRLAQDTAFAEHLATTEERLQAMKKDGVYDSILHKAKNATKANLLRFIVRRYEAGTIRGNTIAIAALWSEEKKSVDPDHLTVTFGDDHYWEGLFFGGVYTHISGDYWTPLDLEKVFPVEKKVPVKPRAVTTELPDDTGSKEKITININWGAVGKVCLVSALILLVTAAITILIGACRWPHLPIFKQVRALLEY